MIIKAHTVASTSSTRRLAAHLLREDENEIAQVADVRGMGKRPQLADMMQSMYRTHDATRGKRGIFHVSISPDLDHVGGMKGEHWDKTLAAIEKEFGLENQARILVVHHKKQENGKPSRPHIHALWQIADVARGRQVDDFANSGRRCGDISRAMEKKLEHRQLPRNSHRRTYSLAKAQILKRSGIKPEDHQATIRAAWTTTRTGAEFAAALKKKGYTLAQGERPLIVTREGDHMAIARELGVKAKDVKARLHGLKLEPVEAVKERAKAQTKAQRPTKEHTREAEPMHEATNDPQHVERTPDEQQQANEAVASKFADNTLDQTTSQEPEIEDATATKAKEEEQRQQQEPKVKPRSERAQAMAARFAAARRGIAPKENERFKQIFGSPDPNQNDELTHDYD